MTARSKTYPIVENAIDLLGDWLKHRRETRELRDMNSGDLARIARDLCVSPADLDTAVRLGSQSSKELPRLLKSIGIVEAEISPSLSVLERNMERVCAACQEKRRCNRELDAKTAAQHYGQYCPNASAIEELTPPAPERSL